MGPGGANISTCSVEVDRLATSPEPVLNFVFEA